MKCIERNVEMVRANGEDNDRAKWRRKDRMKEEDLGTG